ncbi:MAG: glycosyltransferase family A protein [Actinomycetota bacterium]
MITAPRVSVIVPVRNRRDLLGALLEALARQTLSGFEVVVVDDGSNDGSAEEANAWAARGLTLRVLRTQGVGAVGARRLGVEASRGDVLAFTDSDCVPEPRWLAEGLAAIEAGVDVVEGATHPVREMRAFEHAVRAGDDGLYNTCNVFYRREAYEAAGGFDGNTGRRMGFRPGSFGRGLGFGEDTLLGWRVRRAGRAAFAPLAIVRHQVLRSSPRETINRTWMCGGFPALVREVPELRGALLKHRLFLGRRRVPLYVLVAALLLRRRNAALIAAAWWFAARARDVSRTNGAGHGIKRGRLLDIPVELARDVVSAAALLAGSAKTRTPVL